MSKTKHTIGPWEVKPEEAHRDYIRIRGSFLGGKYKIANVLSSVQDGREIGWLVEEARANARLIATAPELLDALDMVLDEIGDAYLSCGAEVRAIVAKAKGETA